jgi:hypothetical protein
MLPNNRYSSDATIKFYSDYPMSKTGKNSRPNLLGLEP